MTNASCAVPERHKEYQHLLSHGALNTRVGSESARIRRCQPADLDNGYDICLQTADGGQDGTALFSHAGLPRDVYAAPCALIEPSLALVAEDAAGVGGYIVAALDGRDFR